MVHDVHTLGHALLGGVLIGAGSLIAAAASGKIPGISGMFSRVIWPARGDLAWRLAFFGGLLGGAAFAFALSEPAALFRPVRSLGVTAVAGLLVGLGTRLGGGCTSGHGVCGLGLGSRTALAATLTFMATGIATVFILNQVGGHLLR